MQLVEVFWHGRLDSLGLDGTSSDAIVGRKVGRSSLGREIEFSLIEDYRTVDTESRSQAQHKRATHTSMDL